MALEILVSEHIVIHVLRKELFEVIIDFKRLPEFFDFILRVEELDDLSYSSVGKKYLEFVKGPIFSTRPVLLELTEIEYPSRVKIQTDGRLFGHTIQINFRQNNKQQTELELIYVIRKNLILFYLPGIERIFRKRLTDGLLNIKKYAERVNNQNIVQAASQVFK